MKKEEIQKQFMADLKSMGYSIYVLRRFFCSAFERLCTLSVMTKDIPGGYRHKPREGVEVLELIVNTGSASTGMWDDHSTCNDSLENLRDNKRPVKSLEQDKMKYYFRSLFILGGGDLEKNVSFWKNCLDIIRVDLTLAGKSNYNNEIRHVELFLKSLSLDWEPKRKRRSKKGAV